MKGFTSFLEKYFMPFAGKVADQRHLVAVRDGLIATMPFLIIGSFFLIIAFPPIASLDAMVAPFRANLLIPVNATFDIMALIATFAIGYSLAVRYKLDGVAGGSMSLVAFLVSTPTKDGGIPTSMLGSGGLFVAIIVSLLAIEVQRMFVKNNIVIKMPQGVPPAVARAFSALLPGLAVLLLFWAVRLTLGATLGINLHQVVGALLTAPLSALGGTLPGAIVAVLAIHLLWTSGIHGAAIVGGIMGPIWLGLTTANQTAKIAGQALPNVISTQFFELWVYIGGSGTTLALAFLMLFMAKSKQLKSIGKMSVAPGLFNINEPITFGMPVVMNPILMVPFILTPVLLCIITYIAMSTGLVARPFALVPWTTPILFGGFLSTGSWTGAAMQVVNFTIAGLIYYPFFRLWDAKKLAEETSDSVKAA